MKLRNLFYAAVFSLGFAACAHLAPTPAFVQELNKQYQHLSTSEGAHMYDWTYANHFRSKGQAALNGVDVQPENPETWNVPREYLPELNNAYDMLQIALVPDAKKVTDPINAAQAQAYFDCWVEQAHRKWTPTNPESDCRAAFYRAMCRMYNKNCSGDVRDVKQTVINRDRIYRVHFALDKADINAEGRRTISDAVAAYRAKGEEVIVAGHADRSGSNEYNLNLSKRRAAAVKAELVRAGIPAAKINGKYFGEEQPLVQTQDDVVNGHNRRVLIIVR